MVDYCRIRFFLFFSFSLLFLFFHELLLFFFFFIIVGWWSEMIHTFFLLFILFERIISCRRVFHIATTTTTPSFLFLGFYCLFASLLHRSLGLDCPCRVVLQIFMCNFLCASVLFLRHSFFFFLYLYSCICWLLAPHLHTNAEADYPLCSAIVDGGRANVFAV